MKRVSFYILLGVLAFGCKQKAVPEPVPNVVTPVSTEPAVIKKIAAWGDSYTQGGGITLPEYAYPVQLQQLSRYEVYNGGIGGQTSSQIKLRMLAAPDKKEYNTIIWAGTNNFWEPEIVKTDIAQMVAFLGHKRFMILSVFNDASQRKGTTDYNTIIKLNNDLKEIYKENYLDVRTYLVSQSNGSVQDEKDKADDVIPSSLMSDKSHPNDKGYALVAAYVYNNFSAIKK